MFSHFLSILKQKIKSLNKNFGDIDGEIYSCDVIQFSGKKRNFLMEK